jgi:hypothetical protein
MNHHEELLNISDSAPEDGECMNNLKNYFNRHLTSDDRANHQEQ